MIDGESVEWHSNQANRKKVAMHGKMVATSSGTCRGMDAFLRLYSAVLDSSGLDLSIGTIT
jgi:hypothetical protein